MILSGEAMLFGRIRALLYGPNVGFQRFEMGARA
jgi:hypothetical protein